MTEGHLTKILLVEDDEWDALSATNGFARSISKPIVTVARDGVEALEILRREGAVQPDLILLDLNLPRMDGREFLALAKNDPALRRIPIIVLTTSKAQKDVLKAYDLHANSYMNKPFDADDYPALIHTIEQFWLMFNVSPVADPHV
jgi:CheY-like chemotaxis protein